MTNSDPGFIGDLDTDLSRFSSRSIKKPKIQELSSIKLIKCSMSLISGKKYIDEIWNNLEVYFHGGVSFNPYRNEFENIISKKGFKFYEIYNASEGFFAIQDSNERNDLLLMLDYGIFYEFISIDDSSKKETIIGLSQVELGINYAMLITTNSGLWRYKIGDTVKFTSLNPYRIIV